jgi:hypothetical protein
MKTVEVLYTASVYVDIPADWDLEYQELEIIDMAIQHWEKYPDGEWEVVGEVED